MKLEKNKKSISSVVSLSFSLRQWVAFFFAYALSKNKNFYWAWKSFLIIVRHQKAKTFLVLEIPLPDAPYLVQKHVDITTIPKPVVVQSLLFLYDFYESSPKLTRNSEYSIQFLSFRSFLFLLMNGDISLPKKWNEDAPISQKLVFYLLQKLEEYHVQVVASSKRPSQRSYSLYQLTT